MPATAATPSGATASGRAGPSPRARVYDYTDPAVIGRDAFGVIDHVGRATLDGAEGWGLFEHATIGRHDPSGFADYLSVAP